MKLFTMLYVFLFQAIAIFAHEDTDNAIHYTADTFPDEVIKNNHFVMFYAPWCGHCSRLAPTWEQLSSNYNKDTNPDVVIAKVDCTVETSLCSEHDVTGYPTLKFFKRGESEGIKYRGTRDLASLISFIDGQREVTTEKPEEVPEAPAPVSGMHELTSENFESRVAKGKHFIKFYAPWCGHCQQLAPIWEELAESLKHDQEVKVGKVDCTKHKSVCNSLEVKSYPSLLWIEDGKKVEKYEGKRTHEDLKDYVSHMLGVEVNSAGTDDKLIEKLEEEAVGVLGVNNFRHGIEKGITFVKFFAPWCGHCKRLAPIWEELGKKFIGNTQVKIAKVDCTVDSEKDLCSEEQVDGFPTLVLYKDGERVSEYTKSRSVEDLYEFVINHLDKHDEL